MGLLQRLARWFGKDSNSTFANPAEWLFEFFGGSKTVAGVRVTPNSSLQSSAVWACVRVKSEDVGKPPCYLMQKDVTTGDKRHAVEHYLYDLILCQPNPRMTAMEFRQVMQTNLDLKGNALAIKDYDSRGRVSALWPVNWDHVWPLLSADGRELFYRITLIHGQTVSPITDIGEKSGTIILPAEDVLHLRGMTLNGVLGLSPIAYHRETIGLALAAQQYGAAFFGNSAQPNGGIKIPTTLSPDATKLLRDSFEERHRGSENAKKIAIFDGGMEWVQTGMDNTDAQYLETRKFQNSDIYRIFRMPPHKVGDLEKATFSNIEQQALEYVQDCLLSEIIRWEQALGASLLTAQERQSYCFEFDLDILLRGDLKSRMESFAIGRNWGLFNADECRAKLNMNRISDGTGQIYLQPVNMVEAGTKPPPISADGPGGARALIAHLQTIVAREEAKNAQ